MNFKILLLLLRKVRFFFGKEGLGERGGLGLGLGGGVGSQRGGSSPLISWIELVSKSLLTSSFRDLSKNDLKKTGIRKS